jgi:uncharacterized protein YheU (UPF0270 family)
MRVKKDKTETRARVLCGLIGYNRQGGTMIIPYDKLSCEALHSLIREFVSSTDDNGADIGIEDKVNQVLDQIKKEDAVITFDEVTETCHIILKKDYDHVNHLDRNHTH